MNGIINFFLLLILRKRVRNYIGFWKVRDGETVRDIYPCGWRYTWIWSNDEGTTALDRFIHEHRDEIKLRRKSNKPAPSPPITKG